MNELYCQYCGCKEVADYIINIKFKDNDYIILCNKHLKSLKSKKNTTLRGYFKPKQIRLTIKTRELLRKMKKMKNFKFVSNFIEAEGGNKK